MNCWIWGCETERAWQYIFNHWRASVIISHNRSTNRPISFDIVSFLIFQANLILPTQRMLLAILVTFLLVTVACEANMGAFVRCTLRNITTLESSGVKRQTLSVKSLMTCSTRASNHKWPETISYIEVAGLGAQGSPEYTFWGSGSSSRGDVVRGPAPGPPTCMVQIPGKQNRPL